MFKNTFQSGFLSILYSIGSKPLQIWEKKVSVDIHFQPAHCANWQIKTLISVAASTEIVYCGFYFKQSTAFRTILCQLNMFVLTKFTAVAKQQVIVFWNQSI